MRFSVQFQMKTLIDRERSAKRVSEVLGKYHMNTSIKQKIAYIIIYIK